MRCAIRRAITVVFPVPAPATIMSGPSPCSMAARCSSSSSSGSIAGGGISGEAGSPVGSDGSAFLKSASCVGFMSSRALGVGSRRRFYRRRAGRGVQSRVMATDAPASHAALRSLPPVGEYLRRLFDLGKQSIPVAIPALVFLWFYHFGTELYLEIAGHGTSPLGYPDTEARLYQMMMKISAYLPLLVLVYTPFLPLQDALMRGQPPSFLASIRHVLERLVPFIISAILQFLIVILPIGVVLGIVILAIAPLPTLPPEAGALIAVVVAVPAMIWIFLAAMFLVFAVPAVVLDGHGPGRAIGVSVRMVAGNFWGV